MSPRLRNVEATSSQQRRSRVFTVCMSVVSAANVRSEPIDFSGVYGVTSRSSMPWDASIRPCATVAEPVAWASVASGVAARSATESMPHAFSRRSSEGPMPGMPRSGMICTNSAWRAFGISSMPSGLALVEAILATSLFAAMPTEQVTW